jgi:hypothetical protein
MDYSDDWDLSTIPKDVFYREAHRRRSTAPRPGRRVSRPCPYCKEMFATAELNAHKPLCPQNPRVQRILAAHTPDPSKP